MILLLVLLKFRSYGIIVINHHGLHHLQNSDALPNYIIQHESYNGK